MDAIASRCELLEPSLKLLPQYAAALTRGWSPNNLRDVSGEQLEQIGKDAAAFIASVLRQTGHTTQPDGSVVPKLPSRVRWIWDEAGFAGHISLRWQPGTDTLPDYVLGHIGYAVVPWRRRRGHAMRALALMLAEAREVGLRRLQITTDSDNVASRRVIEANGGQPAGEIVRPQFGPQPRLLYVIDLA